jgi:hypothetical protein
MEVGGGKRGTPAEAVWRETGGWASGGGGGEDEDTPMLHDATVSAGVELVVLTQQGGFQRAVVLLCKWVGGESLSGSSLSRDGAAIGIICRGGEGTRTRGSDPLAAVTGASTDEASELLPPSAEGQRRGGGRDRALLFVDEFKSTSSVQ